MDQLSGTDYVSIFAERGNVYNHVGLMMVYDVTTAPEGKVRFKDILRHFQDRLHLNPAFRRRLATVPFGLDRPYWLADSEIDVEFHVRHIALPEPGDWRQLMIQVARLHSRPLDQSHPLWEVYVIEGLDNIPKLPPGAFAVYLKIHHAVFDGMATVQMFTQMHSDSPLADAPAPGRIFADRAPLGLEIAVRALSNNVKRLGTAANLLASTTRRVATQAGERLLTRTTNGKAAAPAKPAGRAPRTRFSTRVSPNRVMEGFGMPLSRIKRVRSKLPGITLNDIFISVSGGAVRSYLVSKGELPAQSLSALMPISLRTDASAGGNEVAGVPVPVCSQIADPIERLYAVHEAAAANKAAAERMGLDMMKNLLEVMPSSLVQLALDKFMLPRINMTVSNVRGPEKTLYLAGAKAMCMYPVSIPADGGGLNITGISYNGVMWVSMVSCRNMLPDPGFFIACMRSAWEELLAAADALPMPETAKAATPAKKPRKAPKRAAKTAPAS